jgi:aminoglycoside phosphotransferase family enzyme
VSVVQRTTPASDIEHWLFAIRASVGTDSPVEVLESRSSWIILTPQHVYKIKKPLDLPESRQRKLPTRHQACLDEYWLNEALAHGVYIGVLPITDSLGDKLELNGKGKIVDWVVKMRRLRADRNLLWLIKQALITPKQVTALAQTLAAFYNSRPPETDSVDDLLTRLHSRIAEHAAQLKILLPIGEVCTLQQRFLDSARRRLNSRVCDGRVVDGHGNLRAEKIFFERRPVAIGRLDDSRALRKLDSLDDLCLLAAQCERLGRRDIAAELEAQYNQTTRDDGAGNLQSFYKSLSALRLTAAGVPLTKDRAQNSNGSALTEAINGLRHAKQYVRDF